MKINKISIENFRSIKKAEIIVSDFNIFVGQNNCGKTNLFEAVEFFFNGYKGNIQELIFKRDSDIEMYVEIEFTDIQDGLAKMQNEKNKATFVVVTNVALLFNTVWARCARSLRRTDEWYGRRRT